MNLSTMEAARMAWMDISKLGGCLSNKNQNPKKIDFFAHIKNLIMGEEVA